MVISLSNWVVIYPESKEQIRKDFEKLGLKEFATSIILINNNISEEEADEYVKFIQENLKYNNYLNVTSEGALDKMIEEFGGVEGDEVIILKDGNVIKEKLFKNWSKENGRKREK